MNTDEKIEEIMQKYYPFFNNDFITELIETCTGRKLSKRAIVKLAMRLGIRKHPISFREAVQKKNGMNVDNTEDRIVRYVSRKKLIEKCEDIQNGLRRLYGENIPDWGYVTIKVMHIRNPTLTKILIDCGILRRTAYRTYIVDYVKLLRLLKRAKKMRRKMISVDVVMEIVREGTHTKKVSGILHAEA